MSNVDTKPDQIVCKSGGLPGPNCDQQGRSPVEIITSREVPLGGPRAMTVRRTLPQRQRSLIGPWCFVDHYGPADVSVTGGMDVAPHPHTGLQTVSWLFDGAIQHIDSGGNAGLVLPGEVNLMTAGAGICHSEVSTEETTTLHGVQLWLALPDATRHRPEREFEHFEPTPVPFDGGEMLVFLGRLGEGSSPVHTHTPLLGAEIRLNPGAVIDLPVDPRFEHGLLVDSGDITLENVDLPVAAIGYTGIGVDELRIANRGDEPGRLILLGGEPFPEEIVMWWNFVGRTHSEIAQYREEWQAEGERFGAVDGYVGKGGPGRNADGMGRLPAPRLPDVTIKARKNPPPRVQGGPEE
ncbi:pirin family protein [Brevibacterium permense]|uniref:pirin family protein n=1 Tax=Brevibacterium permense TaxID=234834 RepID=UPI0021D1D00C|nr:pirin family protein [Brevibacterium permense]MCU4298622.1 pirin family protein [Brevibacterium permense]